MKRQNDFKRLLLLVSKKRIQIISMFFLAVITVILTLYIPILTGASIDTLIGKGSVDVVKLIVFLKRMAFVVAGAALTQWMTGIISNKISYEIAEDLRRKAFAHMQKLPISYMDKNQAGDLMNRIISDVGLVSDGLLLGITQLITGGLTILGTIGFMVSIHFKIAMLVVVLTPLSLFVASYIAKRTFRFFQTQSLMRAQMSSLVEEMVGNEKLVQAFSYEKRAVKRFEEINKDLQVCGVKATFFSSLSNPASRVVNNLIYAGVGVFGAFTVLSGQMSVGQLISFLQYANQYTRPFNEISSVLAEFTNALAGAGRIFDFLEEETESEEDTNLSRLDKNTQDVKVEHVSFAYEESQPVLKDISMEVLPGQHVALVGPSGCGKTTIINLMMRFYDAQEGKIYIGKQDITKVTKQSLRRNIGMVLQDTWLKTGTVHDNITYGKPEATREAVIIAAKHAKAHSFIKRLPKGYDTWIQEDGGNLSQGQKQLLCIARVMLVHPQILFLDEATSSIDTRTEIKVSKAFDELMEGRTSFVVAHRLSTIREADVIMVMKEGHIIEKGTHQELLHAEGFYAELYRSQFAHDTPSVETLAAIARSSE